MARHLPEILKAEAEGLLAQMVVTVSVYHLVVAVEHTVVAEVVAEIYTVLQEA
jgi:hypothetical protein